MRKICILYFEIGVSEQTGNWSNMDKTLLDVLSSLAPSCMEGGWLGCTARDAWFESCLLQNHLFAPSILADDECSEWKEQEGEEEEEEESTLAYVSLSRYG